MPERPFTEQPQRSRPLDHPVDFTERLMARDIQMLNAFNDRPGAGVGAPLPLRFGQPLHGDMKRSE